MSTNRRIELELNSSELNSTYKCVSFVTSMYLYIYCKLLCCIFIVLHCILYLVCILVLFNTKTLAFVATLKFVLNPCNCTYQAHVYSISLCYVSQVHEAL